MKRFNIWRLNRKARYIRDAIVELEIQLITVDRYQVELWFTDDDLKTGGMVLQEFRWGTPTKKFLHKIFGNYTGGALQ